jgi:4'-phosphopantetheinyl transferase
MSSTASWPAERDVLVFIADARGLTGDSDRIAESRQWMSMAERDRFDRFRHDQGRVMFALGRLMARTLVGRALGVSPDAWAWREGPHGRPEVAHDHCDVHFNVSHSAGLVLCAIARGRQVGIDVEDLARPRPNWALVERYCSPAEADDIRQHGDRWPEQFLKYWTLKEAYLKARGVGISVPLAEISFAEIGAGPTFAAKVGPAPSFAFHLFQPSARHLAAVAAETVDGTAPEFSVQQF